MNLEDTPNESSDLESRIETSFGSRDTSHEQRKPKHWEQEHSNVTSLHQTISSPLSIPSPLRASTHVKYLFSQPQILDFEISNTTSTDYLNGTQSIQDSLHELLNLVESELEESA